MTYQQAATVSHANAILAQTCMEASGLTYPRGDYAPELEAPFPDRRYGLWSLQDAESNGYQAPPPTESDSIGEQEAALGDSWYSAATACYDSVDELPIMSINSTPEQTVVDRGMNDSYTALFSSDVANSERSKWEDCIKQAGLSVNSESETLIPQVPSDTEQQISVATTDAQCKQDLQTIQTMADYEAELQMDYIDDHEGELNAFKAEVTSAVEKAEAIISARP